MDFASAPVTMPIEKSPVATPYLELLNAMGEPLFHSPTTLHISAQDGAQLTWTLPLQPLPTPACLLCHPLLVPFWCLGGGLGPNFSLSSDFA